MARMAAKLQLARLDDRAVIAVTGEDARAFLHNLLTQDVTGLAEGELRYGALLTPQGRLLHDLFLWGAPDGVRLDVAAQATDDLLRRLALYRLRARVRVEAEPMPTWALWAKPPAGGPAPLGPGWRPDPRHPALGWRRLGDPAEDGGAERADAQAYGRHRLALGVADAAADGLGDRAYPIEANLDLLNGIDFHKGCFVGQETTSRMKRRGQIKTRLLPLRVEAGTPGEEVLTETGLRAGTLTAVEGGRALALLRLDRLSGALTVAGGPVRIDWPDWLPAPAPAAAEGGR